MNLYFFDLKTANYELVRENIDDLEADEIKSTIIEFFYESSLDSEASNILKISSFETTCNLYYQIDCKEQSFCILLCEHQQVNLYNTIPKEGYTITLTTTTGKEYEV